MDAKTIPLTSRRFLLAHTNSGNVMVRWHEVRADAARALGYDLTVFGMADHFPHVSFPRLDRLWHKRDAKLMRLYDLLAPQLDACDVFIHFNGALIHPEFLAPFRKFTVYQCADDPDASAVLSRPVAPTYDLCAIANAACVDMYRSWGCRHVFFWPLGALVVPVAQPDERLESRPWAQRDVPLVFVGSKLGVPRLRFIGKRLGLYRKKAFMTRIEREFLQLTAYGAGWSGGRIEDEAIADLYGRSRLGLNVHNSLGPINFRLYDLAACGTCQICDNKATLSLVFEEGNEIVGFDSLEECIESIRYYLAHPDEAAAIGSRGQLRFLRDYTMSSIWRRLFAEIEAVWSKRE